MGESKLDPTSSRTSLLALWVARNLCFTGIVSRTQFLNDKNKTLDADTGDRIVTQGCSNFLRTEDLAAPDTQISSSRLHTG